MPTLNGDASWFWRVMDSWHTNGREVAKAMKDIEFGVVDAVTKRAALAPVWATPSGAAAANLAAAGRPAAAARIAAFDAIRPRTAVSASVSGSRYRGSPR